MPEKQPLRDVVQSFWQVTRENLFEKEVIIPMGIVEIIFNFTTETKLHAHLYDSSFIMPRCFVQGYHTSSINLTLPARQSLYGVVLQTATAKQILGVPPGELARQCIDLTLIDPSVDTLWHLLSERKSFQERTTLLARWVLKRMSGLSDRDHYFNKLFTLNTNKTLTVPCISDWLCYSPRHLARKFYELSGLNTEQTLLYLKYLKAKRLIHHSDLTLDNKLSLNAWRFAMVTAPLLVALSQFFTQNGLVTATAGWLQVLSFTLWIVAFYGMFLKVNEAFPMFSTLGFLIAVYACIGGAGFGFDGIYTDAMGIASISEARALHAEVGLPLIVSLFLPGALFPLILVLAAILLIRAKQVKIWVGVLLIVAAIGFPLSRMPRIELLSHIDNALLVLSHILIAFTAGNSYKK